MVESVGSRRHARHGGLVVRRPDVVHQLHHDPVALCVRGMLLGLAVQLLEGCGVRAYPGLGEELVLRGLVGLAHTCWRVLAHACVAVKHVCDA